MDFYEERKKQILTQDEKKSEEYSISLPISLFKEQKEADTFIKAFYWSPTYIMKRLEWERVEVKPFTYVRFIKKENWRYYYHIIQERVLPTKEK